MMRGHNLSVHRDWLVQNLNEQELRTFCQDLGVDYDSLPGEDKVSKSRELSEYMNRHGRLHDFTVGIQQLKQKYAPLTSATPYTLPRREPFFGREEEIARGLIALDFETRGWGLIIDGIGGIGKTALAVELAYLCQEQSLFEEFIFTTAKQTALTPTGERKVLDSVNDLAGLLSDIGHAIGATQVVELTDVEQQRALVTFLKQYSNPRRRVLLILDNLETLSSAEQESAVTFLSALPYHCKAITTSRRQVVDNAAHLRLEKLEWSAARQIIQSEMDRAASVRRAMREAGEERWQELYDAAGGSPLALNWLLGLVRMKNLSFDRVLELVLNQHSDNSALHQFIYREARQSMTDNDWRVLGSLALFTSPPFFSDLVAVSGLPRLALETALDRLSSYALVNVLGVDGPYSLHPLTYRLVTDELACSPTLEEYLKLRFGKYWLDYASQYGGNRSYETYRMLEKVWPNPWSAACSLHDLMSLSEEQDCNSKDMAAEILPGKVLAGETATVAAQRLVALENSLFQFLFYQGYWLEAVRLGCWGFTAARARETWRDAGWCAFHVAGFHYYQRETTSAQWWAKHMERMMTQDGNKRDWAFVVYLQGLIEQQLGNWVKAEALFKSALTAFNAYRELEFGSPGDPPIALINLGELAFARQDYARAEKYYREALDLAEEYDNKQFQASLFANLGELMIDNNQSQQASQYIEEALTLAKAIGRKDEIARTQYLLAKVKAQNGDVSNARSLAKTSLETAKQLRYKDLSLIQSFWTNLQEHARE